MSKNSACSPASQVYSLPEKNARNVKVVYYKSCRVVPTWQLSLSLRTRFRCEKFLASPGVRSLPGTLRASVWFVQRVGAVGFAEYLVDIVAGSDQREMGESLRVVTQRFAGQPDLFRIEADVVAVGQHLFKHQPRFVEPTGTGKGLGEPEAARAERSLDAAQAVIGGFLWIVAMHQRIGGQFALYAVER